MCDYLLAVWHGYLGFAYGDSAGDTNRCHMLSWALDSAWVVTIFGIPFRSQCFITSCYAPRLQGDASCVGKGLALVFSLLRQGLHFTQIYEERERREGEGRGRGIVLL